LQKLKKAAQRIRESGEIQQKGKLAFIISDAEGIICSFALGPSIQHGETIQGVRWREGPRRGGEIVDWDWGWGKPQMDHGRG